jgi:Fe-S cluster biogenesis protein NfuA
MEITNDELANGITYRIDLSERVLNKLYNVFIEAADEERGRFSPLLQGLKSATPRIHDQKNGIHSLQIENTDEGARLIVKTRAYAYTEDQLGAIFNTVSDYVEGGKPLLDEAALGEFDEKQRKERGDFEPDEVLASTDPGLYMAQACVAAAMNRVYPVVRGDGGDLTVMDVRLEKNILNLDLIASGSCMGCGGATLATMPKVREYVENNLSGRLNGVTVGEIAVYSEYSPDKPAYWVTAKGVRQPNGTVTQLRPSR